MFTGLLAGVRLTRNILDPVARPTIYLDLAAVVVQLLGPAGVCPPIELESAKRNDGSSFNSA